MTTLLTPHSGYPDLLIEGVMTTLSQGDGTAASRVNIAPMGPIVDDAFTRFVFRPFKTSSTYRNLKATGQGVFHIVDDALLIARAAVSKVTPGPELPVTPASHVEGLVLTNACRYHELRVESLDDASDRTTIVMTCVHTSRLRDFAGFNRARHAVLEAAILATRLHLTGSEPVLREYERLMVMVSKTGGPREHQAMTELWAHVTKHSESGQEIR
jgi:uncharacterized protein